MRNAHCASIVQASTFVLCTVLQVARRKLAQAHMWVVFKVVSAYQHQTEVSRDDLVQAGLQGLSTALDKFDPNRGNRLSTLAYTWVREAVGRTYNESACTIKLSERARTNVGPQSMHNMSCMH